MEVDGAVASTCSLPPYRDMTSVTVIIPVFNRAHKVTSAIQSALDQELPNGITLDILVVDDGSSDRLDTALAAYGASVSCLKHTQNRGAAAARNTGIDAAKGDYVAFLDSDDVWLSHKTAVQIAAMQEKNWAASCTAYYLCRPSGGELVSPRNATGTLEVSDLAWGCFVSPGSTLICRRATFQEIGPFDTSMRRLEDWDWLLRFVRRHAIGFIGRPLARIEASEHCASNEIFSALEAIRAKHSQALGPEDRGRFLAAIDLEYAAALLRSGSKLGALRALMRSLLRKPFRHAGLAAVLHNRSRSFEGRR
jgi:glycosyltransferase involved in cell wall biosynthesis